MVPSLHTGSAINLLLTSVTASSHFPATPSPPHRRPLDMSLINDMRFLVRVDHWVIPIKKKKKWLMASSIIWSKPANPLDNIDDTPSHRVVTCIIFFSRYTRTCIKTCQKYQKIKNMSLNKSDIIWAQVISIFKDIYKLWIVFKKRVKRRFTTPQQEGCLVLTKISDESRFLTCPQWHNLNRPPPPRYSVKKIIDLIVTTIMAVKRYYKWYINHNALT